MAIQNGVMNYIDENGNVTELYPKTKSELVEGVLTLEEIQASTDLSGKIASASSLISIDNYYNTFRPHGWIDDDDLNNYIKSGIYFMGYNITNSPSSVGNQIWAPMLVLGNGKDTARQIIVAGANWYCRSYQNYEWNSWHKMSGVAV